MIDYRIPFAIVLLPFITSFEEILKKIYEHEEKYYRIQLWDIAGQDHNAKLTRTFAKNAHGAIVMCDATNINSREE